MRLYNTLSRSIENVEPVSPAQLGLYACGFTVYDYTHLGHLRKYTMDDILIKTLRHAGYLVKFVQNVTDVGHLASDADTGEDKLEKGAKKYGKNVWDIAHQFEDYFWRSMDLMGNARPDVSCRATEHIESQLAMVRKLEAKGFTYVIEGDGVYFDTSKIDDYGKLAHLDIEHLKEGARVEMVLGKRNPTDFALWKFERPGENRVMIWPSPWAERSFPGWHIECSAMSSEYLGEQFDIHTGGIDHIPVHHTNEIAQAEAASGKKPFVRYWVHHNFLRVNGEKMSKSLGNFFTIDDLLKKGLHPLALRLLFLTTHYRSEMNFTWEAVKGMQRTYRRLIEQILQFRAERERTTLSEDKLAKINTYRQRFFTALENDLATPEAISILWEVAKSNIPGPDKYDLIIEFDEVLSLGLRTAEKILTELGSDSRSVVEADLPTEVKQLLDQRQAARVQQDWPTADTLRKKLEELGYQLKDTAKNKQEILKLQ
ncbi:MAG: cysteine--tRNA ligase [Candidatus Pacebacteria bacterium CG10_big_fil_rev_8_21_14_0_10_44_11]|nr:MAG: cysteine--tRNA ligase [Candidatus Pacebacteria bacterium CG10_big_fil_rev_8_21_14_0_10_44_11]